jgi:FixJ family two-component response regulator
MATRSFRPPPLQEAQRLAGSHSGQIHLLVTDVVLPQLSGRGLAERLTPEHRDLRVLYMSGYTDERWFLTGAGDGFLLGVR